jgi:hypothetical protein
VGITNTSSLQKKAIVLQVILVPSYLGTHHSAALRLHGELHISSLLEYAFLWRKMLSLHTFRSKRENRENLQLSARAVWQIAVLLLESLNYIQINCIVIPHFARNYKENTSTPAFQSPPSSKGDKNSSFKNTPPRQAKPATPQEGNFRSLLTQQ